MSIATSPIVKTIELSTGVCLEYVEQGNSTGIPLVLLHGATDSWRSFGAILPRLPESIHAFALTQRGHGGSEKPATGYHPTDFAADVVAFLDARDLPSAILVGHSLGSYAAQRVAMVHPDRVRGLMLTGTFTTQRGNATAGEFVDSTVMPLTDPIDPGFVREWQASDTMPPDLLEEIVADTLKMPARIWHAVFQGVRETDFSPDLGKIMAPTLIIWGDQDVLCSRAEQDALLEGIAGSRLIVYEGGVHMAHWEEPERFAADLSDFVTRVATGA